MVFISLIISLIYFVLIFYAFFYFIKKTDEKNGVPEKKISVIIAFKNEATNLPIICKNLNNQSLEKDLFEVIFVDDFSDDNSTEIIEKFIDLKNYRIYKNEGKGKKHAIRTGMRNAKNEIIVTTDADCKLSIKWLEKISVNFSTDKVLQMAIMPVVYESSRGVFEKMQALEFASLGAVTAGFALAERPIMCNGANLAYRKDIFFSEKNILREEIASGDDTFLMFSVKKNYPQGVKYLKDRDLIVETKAVESLKEFVNQRLRWVSKSKYYNDFFTIFVGLVILLLNFFILFYLFTGNWLFFSVLLIIKSIADLPLLVSFTKFVRQRELLKLFPIVQILYPFYSFFIPLCSLFCKYKWK